MKQVLMQAKKLMSGSDSFDLMMAIEKAAQDTLLTLSAKFISEDECLETFNRKVFNLTTGATK